MSQYGYVLSLNSRGIPTFTWNGVGGCGSAVTRAWKNFVDIGLSWLVFLRLLNSNSWLSLLLVLFSTLFYYKVLNKVKTLDNVWTIYCFLIVLPILILVCMVYNRREMALRQGAKVKAAILALFHLHRDFSSTGHKEDDLHVQQIRQLLHTFLDHIQAYFNHTRPSSSHFYWPYGPPDPLEGSVLSNEAVIIHTLHSAVLYDIKRLTYASQLLRTAGAGEAVILRHGVLAADLHLAFQEMALIKEMRTPLVLRACCRFYSTVILPLLLGPFWSLMGRNMGFVFAIFVGLLTHSLILGFLNLTVMYEDPFDDQVMSQSVDNVSTVELADTCKWLMEDDGRTDATIVFGGAGLGLQSRSLSRGHSLPQNGPAGTYIANTYTPQDIQPNNAYCPPNIQPNITYNSQNIQPNTTYNPQSMQPNTAYNPQNIQMNNGMVNQQALHQSQTFSNAQALSQSQSFRVNSGVAGSAVANVAGGVAMANTASRLQFNHSGDDGRGSVRRSAKQVKSPATVASPPMPPIIGSTHIPDGARMDFDA